MMRTAVPKRKRENEGFSILLALYRRWNKLHPLSSINHNYD